MAMMKAGPKAPISTGGLPPLKATKPSERVEEFFRTYLVHVKGEWAGQPLELAAWQKRDLIQPLFNTRQSKTKLRQYRTVYCEVPRKNSKSTTAAGLMLYMLFADQEPGAEIVSAAADREQAHICFDIARNMVEASPTLSAITKIYRRELVTIGRDGTECIYRVISSEAYCLHPETLVEMADGRRLPAGEVAVGDVVVGWDKWRLAEGVVASAKVQPAAPVYRLRTHRGREIVVTGEHPFLTMRRGRRPQDMTHEYFWVKAKDLRPDDRVRVALGWPAATAPSGMGDEEAWALGAWTGDGECGRVRFINVDPEIINKLGAFIATLGGTLVSRESTRQKQGRSSPGMPQEHYVMGVGKRRKSPGREWVGRHFGRAIRSRTKDVPAAIWAGGPDTWASFLAGWLDTDGWVPKRTPMVRWGSMSDRLLQSGQALLARLGVNASIHAPSHTLNVSGLNQLWRLHESLGPHLALTRKREALARRAQETRRCRFSGHDSDRIVAIEVLDSIETVSLEVDALDTHVTAGLITHNSKHGMNLHAAAVDELHAHESGELLDVLRTSVGARRQPVLFIITTAGYDRTSVCWQEREMAVQIRDGIINDPTYLPVIYGADPEDDWTDPKVWKRANPGFGVTIKRDYLASECARAQSAPAYENVFKRLHLNIWTQQSDRWLPQSLWDACDGPVDFDALRGRACFGGMDLAATTDISASVFVFPFQDENGEPGDERRYVIVPKFWIPRDRIENPEFKREPRIKAILAQWVREGYITATPGDTIDNDVIRRDINQLAQEVQLREIGYDKSLARDIGPRLEQDGINMEPVAQHAKAMSGPMKELERLIRAKKLAHGGNPVLRWMFGNLAVEENADQDIRPVRKKSSEKIDGMVALIMALDRAGRQPMPKSVYETRGVISS